MSAEIVGRVLTRMRELGMNPRSASLASGMSDSVIRDMVRKPGMSPTMQTLEKLAGGLQTTAQWLAFGDGGSQEAHQPEPRVPPSEVVMATFGGVVEAGAFRAAEDVVDPDRGPEPVPRDEHYPHDRHAIFDVVGDSMNAATPPIPAGSKVIAILTDNPARHIALRNGDIVVVRRVQAQGSLTELSVKELKISDAEVRYLPRSTNKRHKPIVVRRILDTDDETTVEVLGLVVGVVSKVGRR